MYTRARIQLAGRPAAQEGSREQIEGPIEAETKSSSAVTEPDLLQVSKLGKREVELTPPASAAAIRCGRRWKSAASRSSLSVQRIARLVG